jgi:hypothetical protein
MKRDRLREQDGLIRESIKIFAIIAVIAFTLLDTFSVFNAHRAATGDANNAAQQALNTWVATQGDVTAANASADSFLRAHDDWMVKSWTAPSPTSPQTPDFYVTARRDVSTYVLKYGVHLPWIGKSVEKLLVETGTGSTAQ